MRFPRFRLGFLLLTACFSFPLVAADGPPPADVIVTNARIYTMNPQQPIASAQNALTRQTTEGEPAGGWIPKERISLAGAIRAYTLGAAFAGHREKSEGSLETGKLTDLIVIDRNLLLIEPTEIGKTEVLMTMVGGKVVYESPNWKDPAATEKK